MFFTEIPRLFPRDFHRGDFGTSGWKDGKIWKKGLIFGGRAGIIRLSTLFLERLFDFFLYREAALFFCSFFFTAAAVCFSTAHRRLKAVVFSLREGYNNFRTRGPSPMRGGAAPHPLRSFPMYGRSAPPPRGPLRDSSPCTHQEGAPPLHPGSLCGTAVPAPARRALRPSTPGDFRFTTKVTKGVSGGTPLNPLGGHYHPPSSASAAPPQKDSPIELESKPVA